MATSYPARARREAISLPIPELAPVTITDGRAVIAAHSRKRQADRGGEPSSAVDDGHGEAIVTLRAYGLQSRRGKARVARHQVKHSACSLDGRIGAGGVGDRAVANHVVDNDEGARPGKLDGPLEIAGIVWLVGVNEDEIERTEPLLLNDWEPVECGADTNFHAVGKTGALDVGFGYVRVLWVELEGYHAAARREGACEPNCAIAAQRA